jgi:hypothetical protein
MIFNKYEKYNRVSAVRKEKKRKRQRERTVLASLKIANSRRRISSLLFYCVFLFG